MTARQFALKTPAAIFFIQRLLYGYGHCTMVIFTPQNPITLPTMPRCVEGVSPRDERAAARGIEGTAVPQPCRENRNDGRLARGGADGSVDGREPVVTVGLAAAGEGKEFFLEVARDGNGDPFANLNAIDGADGSDFDRRANEENFVHDVEHLARNHLFLHGDAQIFGELHDGVASDARQNASSQPRGIQRAV